MYKFLLSLFILLPLILPKNSYAQTPDCQSMDLFVSAKGSGTDQIQENENYEIILKVKPSKEYSVNLITTTPRTQNKWEQTVTSSTDGGIVITDKPTQPAGTYFIQLRNPGFTGTPICNSSQFTISKPTAPEPEPPSEAPPAAAGTGTTTSSTDPKCNRSCPTGSSLNEDRSACIASNTSAGSRFMTMILACDDPKLSPSDKRNPDKCVCTAATAAPPEPISDPCKTDSAGTKNCTSGGGQRCNTADGTLNTPGGDGIMTAIGCIPTQPQKLVEGLLKYGTLAAGGVAFLLMLLAALQMITAEGNPDTIKQSQEKFYSAIIGLLLVIFSVLLMQVIGVDLLGLKGFGR